MENSIYKYLIYVPTLISTFNAITIKVSVGFFMELDNLILIVTRKSK